MFHSVLQSLLFALAHPFFVSITAIEYKEKSKSLEVSCRIFYDDLEMALSGETKEKINLLNPPDKAVTDTVLAQYLRKNLVVSINKKPVMLRYLGYEIEADVAWCFLEARATDRSIKQLDIKSELLYSHFDTQSNIFHIKAHNQRKSVKLDNPRNTATIQFR